MLVNEVKTPRNESEVIYHGVRRETVVRKCEELQAPFHFTFLHVRRLIIFRFMRLSRLAYYRAICIINVHISHISLCFVSVVMHATRRRKKTVVGTRKEQEALVPRMPSPSSLRSSRNLVVEKVDMVSERGLLVEVICFERGLQFDESLCVRLRGRGNPPSGGIQRNPSIVKRGFRNLKYIIRDCRRMSPVKGPALIDHVNRDCTPTCRCT
jgi:hypothetical protein